MIKRDSSMQSNKLLFNLACAALTLPALAHSGGDHIHGFFSGLAHPFWGWDHVLAMLAAGAWTRQQSDHQRWLLPVGFVLAIALGGMLGMAGLRLGFQESAIAVSLLALGLLVARALRPQRWLAMLACAVVAFIHGAAHGAEMPAGAESMAYALGFIAASCALQLAGYVVAGRLPRRWLRLSGGMAAMAGGYWLV